MTINDIILEVMANTTNKEGKPIKQSEIIEDIQKEFGISVSPAAFSDRLLNNNMKMNTAIEILDVLDYEVVVRPKKGSRKEYVAKRGEGRKERNRK